MQYQGGGSLSLLFLYLVGLGFGDCFAHLTISFTPVWLYFVYFRVGGGRVLEMPLILCFFEGGAECVEECAPQVENGDMKAR